jgi:CBS domain-containing protein
MTTIAAGDMRHMDNDKATPVQTIMTPLPIETANPSTNVYDLAKQMKEKSKGAVIIVDNQKGDTAGRPAGIITERDIVRKVVAGDKDPRKTLASEIMLEWTPGFGNAFSII